MKDCPRCGWECEVGECAINRFKTTKRGKIKGPAPNKKDVRQKLAVKLRLALQSVPCLGWHNAAYFPRWT